MTNPMYVIVNVNQGDEMNDLMVLLAAKGMTFSVTTDVSKVCASCQKRPKTDDEIRPKALRQTQKRKLPEETASSYTEEQNEEMPMLKESSTVNNVSSVYEEQLPTTSCCPPVFGLKFNTAPKTQAPTGIGAAIEIDMLLGNMKTDPEFIFPIDSPNMDDTDAEIQSNGEDHINNSLSSIFPPTVTVDRSQEKYRGRCYLCEMEISIRSHHMRRHALKHLGFKTFECAICHQKFSRSDLSKAHYERYHPNDPFLGFSQDITPEQADKLEEMIQKCFPDQPLPRLPPGTKSNNEDNTIE